MRHRGTTQSRHVRFQFTGAGEFCGGLFFASALFLSSPLISFAILKGCEDISRTANYRGDQGVRGWAKENVARGLYGSEVVCLMFEVGVVVLAVKFLFCPSVV